MVSARRLGRHLEFGRGTACFRYRTDWNGSLSRRAKSDGRDVGNGYMIGGQNFTTSGDRLAFDVTQTVDSRIRRIDATFSGLNGIFERPTQFSAANTGFYGPMFATQTTTATLEPGSMAFLAGGIACLFAGRRFRRF